MFMSLEARGEAREDWGVRNSWVPPEERTGVPGMNWRELGLGVVWVWTKRERAREEEGKGRKRGGLARGSVEVKEGGGREVDANEPV